MTAVAVAGPYEHTGPYVDGEFWDTTGTTPGFCPDCEHAPCVAGGKNFCTLNPRDIVSDSLYKEICGLLDRLATYPRSPLDRLLRSAVFALSLNPGAVGMKELAHLRAQLRRLVD